MTTVYFHTSSSEAWLHFKISESWEKKQMEVYPDRHHWFFLVVEELGEFACSETPDEFYQIHNASPNSKVALYKGRLTTIEEWGPPALLVADLDNTLVGESEECKRASSRFADYWLKYHYFNGSKLVYNTGRNYQMFLSLYDEGHELLEPDMVITAVGHIAYTIDPETKEYAEHPAFAELYDLTHWNSQVIADLVMSRFPWAITPKSLRVLPMKVFGLGVGTEINAHIHELRNFLRNSENLEHEGVVYKAKAILSDHGKMKFVDIVPRGGGKIIGLRYAQQYFGFDDTRTLVAGDSGNDIEMFRGEHRGVVVGNYQAELGNWLNKKPRPNKYLSNLFWADAVVEAVELLK